MFDDTFKRLSLGLCAVLAATACGSDSPNNPPPGVDAPPPPPDSPPPPPPAVFGKRASRSSTIAISDDDTHVAMVNPQDNSVSVFQTSDNTRISKTAVGKDPSSVVIAGDGKTAYVANRADGTVSRVINIDGGSPSADATADVGAEPVGLALSPSGLKLYVAEFAESRVSIIDTATMSVTSSVKVDRPRALVVTNSGDESDDDEHLLVSQFFGVPTAGGEVKDDGRTGLVLNFPLTNVTDDGATPITLQPIDSGFAAAAKTSPNQLGAMAIVGTRVYITSVSVSPAGVAAFDGNVFPVMYVADLTTNTEVRDAAGSTNLARKVVDLIPTPSAAAPRFIPGDLSDIAFLDGTQIGYAVGRGGDVMLRLEYGAGLKVGAAQNAEIDLLPNPAPNGVCQAPTGVVVSKTLGRGYVNCWANHRLAVVDFSVQALSTTVEASVAASDLSIERGRRFFFTGRARWSKNQGNGARGGEGWSSCGSCHPDGLTDNVTWSFGTGPRQTTSMDGTFSHNANSGGDQKQRVLNWTAVNDELHDFELNVRTVSFGLGVLVQAADGLDCMKGEVTLDAMANPVVPMGASTKELADAQQGACKHGDWDDITNWTKTIRPATASRLRDTAAVARGRALYVEGHCDDCHGGAGWTVSRRPYNPAGGGATTYGAGAFATTAFGEPFVYQAGGAARTLISPQPIINTDATGPGTAVAVGVLQLACALRNVGTFGIPGDDTATAAFEVRGAASTPAQGRAGYNVPALYSLSLGAPYLHSGQSPSLEDLFSNEKWDDHTNAGNANFKATSLGNQGKRSDLIQFLLSIDPQTPEFTLPTKNTKSVDICP